MHITIRRRVVLAVAALVALAAALFALESSHATVANGAGLKPALNGSGENLYNGKKGGTLTVYDSEDFEHLDPGEAYFSLDYEVMYATQRPLFRYLPNTGSKLSPDLATVVPTTANGGIKDGGKVITVHIRTGVDFSPPVNRAVTSADVAYAIERAANPNVANAYFGPYFGDIVGAAKATGGPISGITTPNPTTIVFHLTQPTTTLLLGALSMPISMPVPKSFAAKYDAMKPTQYGTSVEVFTGPYMLKSDATGKFLGIGYQPGKAATLVRNPNWKASTDPTTPAYLDAININIGGSDDVIGKQVLTGSDAVQNDTPTNTNVALAYQKYYNQLIAVPGSGDHYVALNNAHGILKNVNVRRALWAALDRSEMLKIAGGTIVGQVATHFIYPGSDGFAQAGGLAGPKVPWNEHPSGDLAVAESYMKKAGFPSGKYTGKQVIKIVGANNGNSPEQAAITKQAFTSLGFKVNVSDVDQSVMYEKYCGVPKQEIDACPEVGWIRDTADPQTTLYVPFYGPAITQTNNSNWGQVNDPAINAAMNKAAVTLGNAASAAAWAKVDDMLVNQAVAIPWIWDNQPYLEAANVRGINDLWNEGSWDYAFTSLKNG
ncbi:MAG: ABC transporter substrate-binding protein [Solirubrobacteraceae bacterium]